jgi:hypothetical protein
VWRCKYLVHGYICQQIYSPLTYDHRTLKTRLPVRSALFKQRTGGSVVKWVTISESPLLYVLMIFAGVGVGLTEET